MLIQSLVYISKQSLCHSLMYTLTKMYLQVEATQTTTTVIGPHGSNTFLASPPVITSSANAGHLWFPQ